MKFFEGLWTSATYLLSIVSLSPTQGPGVADQTPLLETFDIAHKEHVQQDPPPGPVFRPPGRNRHGWGANFTCDYTAMGTDWTDCSHPDNRGCWLRHKNGTEYNISTNYEWMKPTGVVRQVTLRVTDEMYNADGQNFTEAKLFNGEYPGPFIQACWGDTLNVTVHNSMKHNGTSIHWHGIRQLKTTHMDGVNGVTQCPIAPGDSFTYTFETWQYGTSWYHSHYSVQYADGALGPLTIHGPSSANWDLPWEPLLMTDWGHYSAFKAIQTGVLGNVSTLLNGVGNVTRFNNAIANTTEIPDPYTIVFEKPKKGSAVKRYLLRLINTSFESTFVFSIDNHWLTIVSSDFVPISPYNGTSVLVGIGQRYNVIVEAMPNTTQTPRDPNDNYWIRVWRTNCFQLQPPKSDGYERAGILRYDRSSKANPNTTAYPVDTTDCSDESFSNLHPVVPWTVGDAANVGPGDIGEFITVQFKAGQDTVFPLAKFSMAGDAFDPLRIDYGNPTFLNLNYTGDWPPLSVIYKEDTNATQWVYLVLQGVKITKGTTFGAHPIHLHGHDFAILQQQPNAQFPHNFNPQYINPPRRDVVLLPVNGYVVMAFRTDNPGPWLMHCHIAYHASFGLGLQIMERRADAAALWPDHKDPAILHAQHTCNNWNKWFGDCRNWWTDPDKMKPQACDLGDLEFSPDSGI